PSPARIPRSGSRWGCGPSRAGARRPRRRVDRRSRTPRGARRRRPPAAPRRPPASGPAGDTAAPAAARPGWSRSGALAARPWLLPAAIRPAPSIPSRPRGGNQGRRAFGYLPRPPLDGLEDGGGERERAEAEEDDRRTNLDRARRQALAGDDADPDREAVRHHHAQRGAEPDGQERLLLAGNRHRGQHRLVAQLGQEERYRHGEKRAEARVVVSFIVVHRIAPQGPQPEPDEGESGK